MSDIAEDAGAVFRGPDGSEEEFGTRIVGSRRPPELPVQANDFCGTPARCGKGGEIAGCNLIQLLEGCDERLGG